MFEKIKKLFSKEILVGLWTNVLTWIVIGVLGTGIYFISDSFAKAIKLVFARTISTYSGVIIVLIAIIVVLSILVFHQRRCLTGEQAKLSEDKDQGPLPYPPLLEPRELRVIEALATGNWDDNEACAVELAELLRTNENIVSLALSELFDRGYLYDHWHSGNRWFRLSESGQRTAIEEQFIEDLE